MRELRGAGKVQVKWLPTDDNPADLFTKILSRQPFERHRKFVLNLAADAAVEQARVERQAKVDASLSLRRAHRSLYSYFRFVLPIELFGG